MGVSTHKRPLGIHPAFSTPEAASAFSQDFLSLLQQNIGLENFYKFAFMKLLVPDNWWKFFAGFEKDKDGKWLPSIVSSHGGKEVDIINDATDPTEVDASLFIVQARPSDEDLRYIVSTAFRKTFLSSNPVDNDRIPFKTTLRAVNKFQNPKLSNPNNLDCLSCHYADTSHQFAIKTFPDLKGYIQDQSSFYPNPDSSLFDRSNQSIALKSSRVVRAFGYFGKHPSIMTRTINDSIESAQWLNNQH